MAVNDQTIPPRNRKSGVWASVRDHAAKKNGGPKVWVSAILGGIIIAGSGVGLLKFFAAVPWYVGVLCIAAGLQVGSRGAFLAALKPIKDGVIDVLKARKESA